MFNSKKTVLFIITLLLLIHSQYQTGYCQVLSIQASVDKNVLTLDEQLTLKVIVSGDVSNVPKPEIPQIKGFTSYSSGRSKNVSIVNGKVSSSVTFTYVLVPQQEGKHTIPVVTVNFKGQTYNTSPIEIEILASNSKQASVKTAPPAAKQPPASKAGSNLFITAAVNKKKAYVNEQITLTFSFYQRVRLLNQPQYSPPDTMGFWKEDLPPQKNYRTTINGREYNVTEIRTALFPTTPGKYSIGKAQLKCTVEDISKSRDDFFRGFFSRGKTVMLETKLINITVLPLPEAGKPAGFKGAVGQFSISSKVDKKNPKTNEAISLTVNISGTGNVKSISEPFLGSLDNYKKYETVSSFNISKKNYKVRGSKSYTTVLSPIVPGKLKIPASRFSFFDPASKSYKTIKTKPITIDVEQGPKESASVSVLTPEGIKYITKDIRYIRTITDLRDEGKLLYKKRIYVWIHLLPAFAFLGLWQYSKRHKKLAIDIGYARRSRASGMVRKRLKKARNLLDTEKSEEFYAALSASLTKFIGDKLNVSVAGMTLTQLEDILISRNVSANIIEDIKNLMSRSDFARFAPSEFNNNQLKSDYDLSERTITSLQKII